MNDELRTPGTWRDYWNGLDDDGHRVPDGAYFYTATVTDGTVTYSLPLASAPPRSTPGTIRIATTQGADPFNNTPLVVSFDLTLPQKLSLQASTASSANYGDRCTALPSGTTCIEERYRGSGEHTIEWPNTKQDGTFFTGVKWLSIEADNFPQNATVVVGSEPRITSLRVDPPLFSPNAGTTLRFDLQLETGATANATVRCIRHENGATVRTISQSVSTGSSSIAIDGLADNGLRLPPGSYTLELKVTDSIGNIVTRQAVMTARY